MTALIPQGLEPLAAWDTRERALLDDRDTWVQRHEWAKAHIPCAASVYRVDFYLLDSLFAVVRSISLDPDTTRPVEGPPVVVPLAELPPAHLLRG